MTTVASRGAPHQITLNGKRLDPAVAQAIIELCVEQTLGLPDRATIRLADPELELVDGDTFAVGRALQVRLGSPISNDAPATVFSGEVVTLEAEIGPTGSQLIVIALDRSHRLRRRVRTKRWGNQTAADIARGIATDNHLRCGRVEAEGPPLKDVLQHAESDWALLERVCAHAGCDVDIATGELQVLRRRATGRPLRLVLGQELQRFRPRLSGAGQVDSVQLRSWNPDQKQAVSETATPQAAVSVQQPQRDAAAAALGGGTVVIVDRPAESAGQAKTMARAAGSRIGVGVIEATASVIGDPRMTVGTAVYLEGVGRRFGGEHRVVAATHTVRGGRGYETRIVLGGGERPLAAQLGGRGPVDSFAAHLVIGIVTQRQDSDKLGRIKVRYPVLDGRVESTWVRVACAAAGAGRGVMVLPEVDDEVVIAFEHGDIERPIVLGALFNGKDKPGEELLKTGAASPQSLALSLPGDVVTNAKGKVATKAAKDIALAAGQDLAVSASRELKVSADGPLEISSKQTAALKGMSTQISAQGAASLQANGALTIKANGAVTISGAAITVSATGVLTLQGTEVMIG
jgi:uncharacterized protein involved in type VI secretion and phage assembly